MLPVAPSCFAPGVIAAHPSLTSVEVDLRAKKSAIDSPQKTSLLWRMSYFDSKIACHVSSTCQCRFTVQRVHLYLAASSSIHALRGSQSGAAA